MDPLAALSALGDATRRRVYEHVSSQPDPVSRDEAATATGIARTLAAYHLDRLAAEGLLTVTHARRSGRTGPGAGRPAKLYARPEREIAVSVPPRDYHLAARLLADAAAADGDDGHVRRALCRAAEELGREVDEVRAVAGPSGRSRRGPGKIGEGRHALEGELGGFERAREEDREETKDRSHGTPRKKSRVMRGPLPVKHSVWYSRRRRSRQP